MEKKWVIFENFVDLEIDHIILYKNYKISKLKIRLLNPNRIEVYIFNRDLCTSDQCHLNSVYEVMKLTLSNGVNFSYSYLTLISNFLLKKKIREPGYDYIKAEDYAVSSIKLPFADELFDNYKYLKEIADEDSTIVLEMKNWAGREGWENDWKEEIYKNSLYRGGDMRGG